MATRRRIDKACTRCRRRKERCDGQQPTCSPCLAHGNECLYSWQQKKRGLPEGWVHTLEKLLALAMAKYPDMQETLLQTVRTGLEDDSDVFAALWTDNENGNSLWKSWRSSLLANQLESLVHRLEQLPRRKMSDYPGDALAVLCQKELLASPRASSHDASGYHVRNVFSLGDIAVPSNILELLELYFSTIHSWMPVVEKHRIYQLAYQISGSWSNITDPDACCLLALLSCAMVCSETSGGNQETHDFRRLARDVVPQRASDLRSIHAQALLLLALVQIQDNQPENAWLLVGEACQVALLTLKSESGVSNTSAGRIIMACFILDTLLSCRLHLRAHLNWKDVPELGMMEEDGMDEWSPADYCFQPGKQPSPMHTNSSFNQLFTMVRIVSRAKNTTNSEDKNQMRADLERWKSQQDNNFPFACGNDRPMVPSQTTVSLVYFVAILILDSETTAAAPDLQFNLTNFLLPLREYTKSTMKSSHVPPIWEPILVYLLDLLETRISEGNHAAAISIDALVAVVSELEDSAIFRYLKARCAGIGPVCIEVPTQMDMVVAKVSTQLPTFDLEEVQQEGLELVTTDALEAEVDWNKTLRDLGFADGENMAMALGFLNE